MPTITPEKKAAVVTAFFSLIGILGWIYRVSDWQMSLPLGIFYLVLTINTFFSIRLFSRITPPSTTQGVVDVLLVLSYAALSWYLGSALWFVFSSLILFTIAPVKYALLLYQTAHPKLMKRKILVDLSGTLVCALTLGGVITGHVAGSLWAFAAAFTIANILLFTVWPLYKPDAEKLS